MLRRTSAVFAGCLASATFCACGSSGGNSSADSGANESGGGNAQDAPNGSGEDATIDQAATAPDDAGGDVLVVDASPTSDSGLPPVDPSLMMATLDKAQLGDICDWMYSLLGGYGQVVHCPASAMMTNPADQAECVAEHSYSAAGCPLTVGQFETCIEAEAPTKGCDKPDPQCTPVFYCHVPIGDN